ncbi:MAG: GPW/gp25 family protein [Bacteroidetes bacterium]|nr:GPW/gp25 family protein [Bacteroidota bacterium]
MKSYIKIPITPHIKGNSGILERVDIEESIKQFIDMLITTKQGECLFNPDFGYEIWTREYEPILNSQKWQPVFMEQIKYLLEKYESRITKVQVREPEITTLQKTKKTDKDYRITLTVSYKIINTGETFNNVKITFEY